MSLTAPTRISRWPERKLKYLVSVVGGGTPDKGNAEFWGGQIPWVSPKDMKSAYITDTEDHITEAGLRGSTTRMIAPGAVLMVVRSGILRHSIPVAINRVPVAINQDMRAFIPHFDLEPRYLLRFIQGHQTELLNEWSKEGTTVESIEAELTDQAAIPLPPLPEQVAIADFLDRETARLDGLVAAKERLLGLLAEKRQTLITRAVTRGLNSKAPLRDSGVAWLGETPAHWEIKRLRFVAPVITVGIVITPAKYYEQSGVPCLRSLNVRQTGLVDNDLVYISQESNELLAKSKIFTGDLVAVRSGQPGTTAVVDERFHGANCIDLIIIRRSAECESEFLAHLLNSDAVKIQFATGSGGAIQQHFNIETARDLLVLLPPFAEQSAIVQHIEQEGAKLDALRVATERTIGLIKERRAALVAAAVTGRLRVAAEPPSQRPSVDAGLPGV